MDIFQHFRPGEQEFVAKVLQWKEHVEERYYPKLTDFLDPREQKIVKSIIGSHSSVKVEFFGGVKNAERSRAVICPEYFQPGPDDFQIALWEIEYPRKFVTLEHRHVLGSLMSIGLRRGKFGDILLEDGRVQFFAAAEVSEYIRQEFTAVGRTTIALKEQPLSEALFVPEQWQETPVTVSSLRLDAVLATVYRLSRQKAQNFIKQGHVKVNWAVVEEPAFECGEGDLLSVKGYGRAKLIVLEGQTKKGKWRLTVGRKK